VTRPRYWVGAGSGIVLALLPVLFNIAAQTAPLLKEKPTIALAQAGELKVDDIYVEDGAVIDEVSVVLVGSKAGSDEILPRERDANGTIVDLAKKDARPFTNGHRACIHSVAVARGRIVTASNYRDPVLRVWDLKAGKTTAEIKIDDPGDEIRRYAAAWFRKGDRIAVAADTRVLVFDPAKPDDRTELVAPGDSVRWVDRPVVSPDDTLVACEGDSSQVVVWDVANRKATTFSVIPEKAHEPEDWRTHGITFGPKGLLIGWRTGSSAEVPAKKAEEDVPAGRRGVVQVDYRTRQVVPLGMGQGIYTLSCAIDPTQTWLATAGSSRPDKPRSDGEASVSELRVYHLPSRKLGYRRQLEGLPLMWVSFTPSGRRIVCASCDGVVRWWDLAMSPSSR
jgi:WD40 repeat protein